MDADPKCVEMKRQGAEHVRKLTQGMSKAQLLEFWADQTRKLMEEQGALRGTSASEPDQRKSA